MRNRKQLIYKDAQRINKETVQSYTNSLFDWAVDRGISSFEAIRIVE